MNLPPRSENNIVREDLRIVIKIKPECVLEKKVKIPQKKEAKECQK